MTTIELARIVRDMRQAQRTYFADRNTENLQVSKTRERAVDRLLADIIEDQPALLPGFGGER